MKVQKVTLIIVDLIFKNYIYTPKQLIINLSEYTPGIHNYCDRWCERCTKTSRCDIFIPDEKPLSVKETLDVVQKNFDETFRLLHDWATKNNIKLEDLQNNIDEAEIKRREKNRRNARTNETSKIAFDYRQNVLDFFRKNKPTIDSFCNETNNQESMGIASTKRIELNYAIDTISWYITQLPVKITRAYVGLIEFTLEDSDPIQNDHNGSAKVVLIGVENSFPAWEIVLKHLPELEDDCWKFLVMLDKIRKRILVDFPNVNAFVRPGFDEVTC